jgi:plasmid stability protein
MIASKAEGEVLMAQILVRNLEEQTVKRLKARAREKGHSLQAEVRDILEQTAQMDMQMARRLADLIRNGIGRRFDDSAKIIRKDRDWLTRRHDHR